MLSPLRNRFGIPGVISVIALVFAMLGGAYAATNNSGGKATASAKAKRGPKGPKGATGPAGPAGPQGPAGANGKDGSNGSNGKDGSDGTDGQPGGAGKSVTVTTIPTEELDCDEFGGAEVKVEGAASGAKVCNGEPGEQGSPWIAGGILPPEATETGAWAFNTTQADTSGSPAGVFVPISFPIPLSAALDENHALYVTQQPAFGEHCHGELEAPSADPGYLCVYHGQRSTNASFVEFGNLNFSVTGTSPSGALMNFTVGDALPAYGSGSWAVTAPASGP